MHWTADAGGRGGGRAEEMQRKVTISALGHLPASASFQAGTGPLRPSVSLALALALTLTLALVINHQSCGIMDPFL